MILDVDGTLVDTNHFHAVSWWRAFRDVDRIVPMVEIHRLIGMGSSELIEQVLGHPDDRVDDLYSRYYRQLRDDMVALPGAADLLRELHRRGLGVVLATSGKPEDVDAQLDAIDARDAIDEVVSSGDADEAKPAPEIFELALQRGGLDRERSVVVGDTVWDGRAAASAGLTFVGVRSGGICDDDLEKAGAVIVYDDAAALLEHLDDTPVGG